MLLFSISQPFGWRPKWVLLSYGHLSFLTSSIPVLRWSMGLLHVFPWPPSCQSWSRPNHSDFNVTLLVLQGLFVNIWFCLKLHLTFSPKHHDYCHRPPDGKWFRCQHFFLVIKICSMLAASCTVGGEKSLSSSRMATTKPSVPHSPYCQGHSSRHHFGGIGQTTLFSLDKRLGQSM